jgi:hypothetical protein
MRFAVAFAVLVALGCGAGDLAPPANPPRVGVVTSPYHFSIQPCLYNLPSAGQYASWVYWSGDGTGFYPSGGSHTMFQVTWGAGGYIHMLTAQAGTYGQMYTTNCWDREPSTWDADQTWVNDPSSPSGTGYWWTNNWVYEDMYGAYGKCGPWTCDTYGNDSRYKSGWVRVIAHRQVPGQAAEPSHSWITTDAYHWTFEW